MAPARSPRQWLDLARALWIYLGLRRHERWSVDQLKAHQRRQLRTLVAHARARSPFYRELYAGIPTGLDLRLDHLPPVDKRTLMENFDRVVTDPRLELSAIEAHLEQLRSDQYYLGRYRALTTSGTSGFRGVFLYDRREWSTVLANTLRWNDYLGLTPRLPRRRRISTIGAQLPAHVSFRMVASGDVGLFKLQPLDALSPPAELTAALNRFQPEALLSYASVAAQLAGEQQAGRLAIHPRVVATHSELLTKAMAGKIEAAWGSAPFNHYGLTELPNMGSDCGYHRGIHAFEDLYIAEVVDRENRPVPDGRPGSKLLLTNLYNRTQPLIRYEVSDRLTIAPEPCPCGRPFRLISDLGGRDEDNLLLPGRNATRVPVPPLLLFDVIEAFPQVTEYRLAESEGVLTVQVALTRSASPGPVVEKLRSGLEATLRSLGVAAPRLRVEAVDELERAVGPTGKQRRIDS